MAYWLLNDIKLSTLDDFEGQYWNRNCISCSAFSLATAGLFCISLLAVYFSGTLYSACEMFCVAARPLMLSHCLSTSPTDDVTSSRQQYQHPVVTSSLLHSPTSLSGGGVVGDGVGVVSPVNSSSPDSLSRPWPSSPTDHRPAGLLVQPTVSWVTRGSASSYASISVIRLNLKWLKVWNKYQSQKGSGYVTCQLTKYLPSDTDERQMP